MRTDLRILRRALWLGAWLFTNLPPTPGEDTGSEIARLRSESQALDQRLRDFENRRAPAQKERSFTSALGPNRDVGIHVFGAIADGALTCNLAWVDGTADGGTSIADNDSAKQLVARLLAEPFKNSDSPLRGLGFGVAVTCGDKDGGAPSGCRTNAQQTFFSWASGVMSTGTQTRIEPQAYYYHGAFGLLGAWAWATALL